MHQVSSYIPIQLINGFLYQEVQDFINCYEEMPIPQVQDTRGLAIAWVVNLFGSHILNPDILIKLQNFVDDIQNERDYHTTHWYRILALQATCYSLTHDDTYLQVLLKNMACKQSGNRAYILSLLAFIATLIDFENEDLQESIVYNMEHNYGYWKESLLIGLASKGSVEDKKEWMQSIMLDESLKSNLSDTFGKGFQNRYNTNFFSDSFVRPQLYFLQKLLTTPLTYDMQTNMFFKNPINEYYFNTIKNHPLNKTVFRIKDFI